MREFMGLNVHTVQFKPDLYKPICRLLRDYHPIEWDFGSDTFRQTTFPMAANGVDWSQLYGVWAKAGYDIDACLMFDHLKADHWKNSADNGHDARAYGEAFARYFGPSGKHPWVFSAEIGNEPSDYSEKQYRDVFRSMAAGLRAGDPKLKIVACAMATGKLDAYSKPLSAIDGLHDLCDVLNIHSYAFKDAWPTWRRSYPEDPAIPFLKSIDNLIAWRNEHAPGKQVWLTEFGYDSATKPPPSDGPWKRWVGVTDTQQAQYIVRSYLVLSALDIDRAYLYFFNDRDEPQLHGASGITRNFHPKPSFYAISHLCRALGDYYFSRAVVRSPGELYCFEYRKPSSSERIYVVWLPTAGEKPVGKLLPLDAAAAKIYRAERMPTTVAGLTAAGAERVAWKIVPQGIELEVSESPLFLWSH
jgi:serine/threonine-protein kinase ATR